jgi:hypothetical protein
VSTKYFIIENIVVLEQLKIPSSAQCIIYLKTKRADLPALLRMVP